jgi:hypothetical protein
VAFDQRVLVGGETFPGEHPSPPRIHWWYKLITRCTATPTLAAKAAQRISDAADKINGEPSGDTKVIGASASLT